MRRLLSLLVLILGCACLPQAQAQGNTCSATVVDANFGSISPISGADYTLTGSGVLSCTFAPLAPLLTAYVSACLNLNLGTSSLSAADRMRCMDAVAVVEQCLRAHLSPDKINLAALVNAVPHLHWHVIARFASDSHFPGSVWAGAVRERVAAQELAIAGKLPAIEHDIVQQLLALRSH